MKHRLIAAYLRCVTYAEIVSAHLLTISAHGDHLGHPFF